MKRIKYFVIAFMAILVVGVIGVNAETYSDEYKTLTSDGTVTIKVSTLDEREMLIRSHINNLNNEQYWFDIESCDQDYTVCQIKMLDYVTGDLLEQHEVTITYEENYSEEFKKLASNGKLTITETFLEGDNYSIIGNIIEKFNRENNTDFMHDNCNQDYTECKIYRDVYIDEFTFYNEARMVQVVYDEKYSTKYQKLTKDGKLTVPHYTVNTLESDYLDSLVAYLDKISTNDYHFYSNGCNGNICNIYGAGEDAIAEYHNVKVTYKETVSEKFKKFEETFKVTQSSLNSDKFQLIWNSLNLYNEKNNMQVNLNGCNSDFSECLFAIENESHNVKLTYKDEYSEGFKKLTKDGKVKITSSDLDSNKYNLIGSYFNKYSNSESSFWVNPTDCNEDYSACTVNYVKNGSTPEQHIVKFTFNDEYNDIFKKLTKDGNITVTSTTLSEDKTDIVSSEVAKLNDGEYEFYVNNCNDDYTICNVVLNKVEYHPEYGYPMTTEIERHNVNVKYKEEYSDKFKKLTSNDKLVVKSIRPSNMEEAEFFLTSYVGMFNFKNHYFYRGYCNEDYSVCDVTLSNQYGIIESHKVNVSYAEVNQEVLNKVNSLISALPKGKRFIVEDLELINYLVRTNYNPMTSGIDVENSVINYSSEIKNYFGNMTAKLDARAGDGNPLGSEAFGGFVVLYDDTVYGLLEQGGAAKNHVIYIPDETKNTTEAYIKAAQDRINKYLKTKDIKIVYGGKLSEDFDEEDYKDIVDTSKIRDEYYILMFGETQLEFLIAKDSSKINNDVVYASNDIMTNVEISANSSSVPLDTTIKVNEITKDNETYKELTDRLNVKDALIYDLKLYSYTTTEYISKLEDGTFSVAIPLTDELKNKELMAYYVKDDGTVEEYEVKIVDGKAVFNTDHFSIYTIAEKTEINETVPNTYDGVGSHIATSIVSLVGLFGTLIYLKKKKLN